MLEKDIQLSICQYLQLRKHFFWRANTVPVYDTTKQSYRAMPQFARNGVPDIILVRDGQFIGLEVKRPGGRLSEAQERFRDELVAAGGQYHVVQSIDDIQSLGL